MPKKSNGGKAKVAPKAKAIKKSASVLIPVGKKEVDKDAPKKPMTAFFWYMKVRRDAIKNEEPGLANAKLNAVLQLDQRQKMAEEWKGLSEREKEKYIKMSDDDKTRYDKELKAYQVKLRKGASPSPAKAGSKTQHSSEDQDESS